MNKLIFFLRINKAVSVLFSFSFTFLFWQKQIVKQWRKPITKYDVFIVNWRDVIKAFWYFKRWRAFRNYLEVYNLISVVFRFIKSKYCVWFSFISNIFWSTETGNFEHFSPEWAFWKYCTIWENSRQHKTNFSSD